MLILSYVLQIFEDCNVLYPDDTLQFVKILKSNTTKVLQFLEKNKIFNNYFEKVSDIIDGNFFML